MNLQEFKTQAEKETFVQIWDKKEAQRYIFYKAMAYRWEDGETADPIINDVEYSLNKEFAIKYADGLKLEIGFYGTVDKLVISESDLEDFAPEFDDFDLDDLTKFADIDDTIHSTSTNEGDDLEGAIIVVWSWEKYVGYARNFDSVRFGEKGETENSINTGNMERTFRSNQSVLLEAKEIEGLEGEELIEAVKNALGESNWKWNYFKNHPTDEKIISSLSIEIE